MKSFEELNPGFKCDLCLGQKKKKREKMIAEGAAVF